MPLKTGNISATSGMTKAIYDSIRDELEPIEGMGEEDMKLIRKSWRKLSYAIANGVIGHIKSNMEIHGVEVSISDVSTNVSVDTCPDETGAGTGTGSGTATGQQSNDGTGHVT